MMLTTSIEKFADVYEEMKSLNVKHYHEISEHAKHGIDLEPDYSEYFRKENNGELLYIALRFRGELVGYLITFIGRNLHYKSCIQMMMDIIYVDPSNRGMSGGKLLIEAMKDECRRRNIQVSIMGCKEAHKKYMEGMLLDCGYKPFEIHYSLWF